MGKIYQKIYAIFFIALLFGLALYNLYWAHGPIAADIAALKVDLRDPSQYQAAAASVDTILTNDLAGNHIWNEIYGAAYRALGKNEENNFTYVRDQDGVLYYGNFWNTSDVEMQELAQRLRRMQDDLEAQGTKVVMLLYPTKYDAAWADGCYGIPYQDMNEQADEFLQYLRRYNVDYVDFREALIDSGKRGKELFFSMDHHWTVPTAFYAAGVLVDHLREAYGEDLDPARFYCDSSHYLTETYEEIFMGSQGRETGEIYGGMDDYTFMLPNFKTDVQWSFKSRSGGGGTLSGTIEDTLISRKYLDYEDPYQRDMNSSYLGGIYLRDEIENKEAKNDVDVLFLRNSYSSGVAVFLTPMVRSINLMWTVNSSEEALMAGIRAKPYDYVFVALNVDNLKDEEFSFYTKEG